MTTEINKSKYSFLLSLMATYVVFVIASGIPGCNRRTSASNPATETTAEVGIPSGSHATTRSYTTTSTTAFSKIVNVPGLGTGTLSITMVSPSNRYPPSYAVLRALIGQRLDTIFACTDLGITKEQMEMYITTPADVLIVKSSDGLITMYLKHGYVYDVRLQAPHQPPVAPGVNTTAPS